MQNGKSSEFLNNLIKEDKTRDLNGILRPVLEQSNEIYVINKKNFSKLVRKHPELLTASSAKEKYYAYAFTSEDHSFEELVEHGGVDAYSYANLVSRQLKRRYPSTQQIFEKRNATTTAAGQRAVQEKFPQPVEVDFKHGSALGIEAGVNALLAMKLVLFLMNTTHPITLIDLGEFMDGLRMNPRALRDGITALMTNEFPVLIERQIISSEQLSQFYEVVGSLMYLITLKSILNHKRGALMTPFAYRLDDKHQAPPISFLPTLIHANLEVVADLPSIIQEGKSIHKGNFRANQQALLGGGNQLGYVDKVLRSYALTDLVKREIFQIDGKAVEDTPSIELLPYLSPDLQAEIMPILTPLLFCNEATLEFLKLYKKYPSLISRNRLPNAQGTDDYFEYYDMIMTGQVPLAYGTAANAISKEEFLTALMESAKEKK